MDASRRAKLWPQYAKTNRSSLFFTRNFHLNMWKRQPCSYGLQWGMCLKHRRRSGLWRFIQLKYMRYKPSEKGYKGRVHHFELQWHLARDSHGREVRVRGSKRYFRFKVCI